MRCKFNTLLTLVQFPFPATIVFVMLCTQLTAVSREKYVFSSLAQLEQIWYQEIRMTSAIEDLIKNFSNPPPAFTQ